MILTEHDTTTPLPGFAGAQPGDTVPSTNPPCLLSSCDRRALQLSPDGQRTRIGLLEFADRGIVELALI
jgi:hypothetical protein